MPLKAITKLLFVLALCLTTISVTAEQVIRFPQSGDHFQEHHAYPIALLKLALSKSQEKYRLVPSGSFMIQGRAIRELESGRNIDLLWTMTSAEREKALRPIRIPIYKGLIGWRVFLTGQPMLSQSTEAIPLAQLKTLNMIQGHDWPDKRILEHNEFKVSSAPSFDGLFQMISLKRADLFPRSIIEVWDELRQRQDQGIKLEQHTVISYPTASYFFTAKNNTALATTISSGLKKAIEDGSFDQLFDQYFSGFINKANIRNRTHYRLENPLLTQHTPLDDPTLWLTP